MEVQATLVKKKIYSWFLHGIDLSFTQLPS